MICKTEVPSLGEAKLVVWGQKQHAAPEQDKKNLKRNIIVMW